MKKLLSRIIFSVLLFLFLLLPFKEITNIIAYTYFTDYAKKSNFHRLIRLKQRIYLLGTIHTAFLTSKEYPLKEVGNTIENIHPDLLLIEGRAKELEKGNYCDGPIEMGFAYLIASSLKIPSMGIDWYENTHSFFKSNDVREDHLFSNIIHDIQGSSSILILTGYSHIPEMVKRLTAAGFREDNFSILDKTNLFNSKSNKPLFPPGMAECLELRIVLDQSKLSHAKSPNDIEILSRNIKDRKLFLSQVKEAH